MASPSRWWRNRLIGRDRTRPPRVPVPMHRPLQTGLVYGETEPVAADQLVVGEAALQMLGDHVDVLEVALDQVAVVGGGGAGRAVDAVDDLRGEPDAVGRGEAEGGAPLQRHRARRGRLPPDIR